MLIPSLKRTTNALPLRIVLRTSFVAAIQHLRPQCSSQLAQQ